MITIAILNPGYCREQAIRELSRMYHIAVIAPQENLYHRMADISFFVTDDTRNEDIITFCNDNNVKGIMTYSCDSLVQTADLAKALGYTYSSPEKILKFVDKIETRSFLQSIKKTNVQFCRCDNVNDVCDFLVKNQYPIVVKPSRSSCSLGVFTLKESDDISVSFKAIKSITNVPIIAETFIDGSEYSAEIIANGEQVVCVGLTEKILLQGNIELGAIFPANLEKNLYEKIKQEITEIISELCPLYGVFHVEFKLCENMNNIEIVEMNGRPAGDYITMMVYHSTGIDLDIIAAKIALGEELYLTNFIKIKQYSGLIFSIVEEGFQGFSSTKFLQEKQRLFILKLTASLCGKTASNASRSYAIFDVADTYAKLQKKLFLSKENSIDYIKKE